MYFHALLVCILPLTLLPYILHEYFHRWYWILLVGMKLIMKNKITLKSRLFVTNMLALLLGAFSVHAQVTAVDFGGNYNDSNSNSDNTLMQANGDFDGEADATDRRSFISIDTLFTSINDTNGVGNNTIINAGFQSTYLDSTLGNPLIGIYRFNGQNQTSDSLQVGSGATNIDNHPVSTTFTPNVVKANFLNGADSPDAGLIFEDAAGSVTVTIQSGNNVIGRALVKNGADWYISDTSIASDFPLTLSINGFTETWYPYDPDTNMYIHAGTLSGGVSGSTLTDIQAFGAACQVNSTPAGQSKNAEFFRVSGFTAGMVATVPPLPPLAVDFGGDYNDTNTSGAAVPALIYENGDFDGDTLLDDRRGYNAMDTIFPTSNDENNVGTNLTFNAGAQVTYFDQTSADPVRGIYRFFGSGQTLDSHQVGTGPTADGVGQTLTYAPNIPKSDFLNGFDDPIFDLSFTDADSIVIDTVRQGGAPHTVHAIVKNGSDWYISGSSSVNTNVLTINGYTETWHPYDPDSNLLIPALTGGVAGSNLTDIQAVGMVGETIAPTGASKNSSVFRFQGFKVLLRQMVPSFPPTTPVQVRNLASQYENDTSDNVHTLAGFRVIDAPDSKLVVAVGGENIGTPISVIYGNMSLIGPVVSENAQDVSLWYLDDPVAGDDDIVVTLPNNKDSRIVAFSLANAADGTGSSASGRSGDIVQLDVNLTTAAPNTLVLGAFVNNGASIDLTPFASPGETADNGTSGSSTMNVGYITVDAITNANFSWVNAVSNRCSAVLIGISPAGEVAPVGDLYNFDMPSAAITPVIDGVKALGEWGDAFQIPMVWPDLGLLPNVGGIQFTANDGSGNSMSEADATEADISGLFWFKWDTTNLYILAEITDDVFIKPLAAGTAGFPDDHFLLAIDPDVTADGDGKVFLAEFFIDSANATRVHYRNDIAVADPDLDNFTNHVFVGSEFSGGYIIELALNWTDLGVTSPNETDVVGISILLVDNDIDDGGRDIIMRSSGQADSGSIVKPELYHQAMLSGPSNTFENFISRFNVGLLNQPDDDADFDGMTNEYEWKFGGNPSVSDVAASLPTVEEDGGNFVFKYNRRLDASALGLTYTVEADDTLLSPDWLLGGLTETDATPINDQFEKVTVETPIDVDQKFIRVRAEQAD